MSPDTHLLIGAYVMDALDDIDRGHFEAHLASCPACVHEVGELRATTTRLGQAVAEPPPARLRTQVLRQISDVRQESPRGRKALPHTTGNRWDWPSRLTAAAAVLALIAAGTLGVQVVRTQHQLAGAQSQLSRSQPVAQVLSAPDARIAAGAGVHGVGTATVVTSASLGSGVLTMSGMPGVPSGRTYQAWVIGASGPRPAGLAGSSGSTSEPLLLRDLRGVTTVALTVEPAGGSARPTTTPVLLLRLPS